MSPRHFLEESLADLQQAARSIDEAIKLAKDRTAEPYSLQSYVQVARCRLENIEMNLPKVKL